MHRSMDDVAASGAVAGGEPGEWWRHGVLYQIYPLSFQDSNGDGRGDLPGINQRLDYLSWLGVDGVWINPFFQSPMIDFGYDISDHRAVDGSFGTSQDAEELIRQLHRRGLRVVIDFVPNHTSDQHSWFQDARSSPDAGHRDWYVWRPPAPDGGPPNNWKSAFGGPAWTFEPRTGEYYLHTFHTRQPDLNWRNPRVEQAMFDVVRHWLDLGVDGFRLDAVHHIAKHPDLPDNPPHSLAEAEAEADRPYRLLGEFDTLVHLHDKNDPFVHGVLRRFRRLLNTHPAHPTGPDQVITEPQDRLSTGEVHLFDWPDWPRHWAAYYGDDQDELHMPLNLGLVDLPWSVAAFRKAISTVEDTLPSAAWPNLALGNHDESRVVSRYGRLRARAAMLILLTLRGTPIIYYGDELGLPDTPLRSHQTRDPWARLQPALGRDPQRSPMPWTPEANGDFCGSGIAPWLPLHPRSPLLSVESQATRPDSMLQLTRHLLRLRRTRPELVAGSLSWLEDTPADILGYRRDSGDRHSYCLVNFTTEPAMAPLPEPVAMLASTVSSARDAAGSVVRLRPHEAVIAAPSAQPTQRPSEEPDRCRDDDPHGEAVEVRPCADN